MAWIDNGYMMLCETDAPGARESPNAPSVFDHREFLTGVIKDMAEDGALTRLSKDRRPTVVIIIGVVRKLRSDKFRVVISTSYMNKRHAKKAFKFEG